MQIHKHGIELINTWIYAQTWHGAHKDVELSKNIAKST